eukprot:COSAG01_NODE_7651_length_3113_cov_14.784672_5_plen_159_part_01
MRRMMRPRWPRAAKYGAWSNSKFRLDYQTISLRQLLGFIDRGVLDAAAPITMKHLHDAGVMRVRHPGVKLLSDGAELVSQRPPVCPHAPRSVRGGRHGGGGGWGLPCAALSLSLSVCVCSSCTRRAVRSAPPPPPPPPPPTWAPPRGRAPAGPRGCGAP